MVTLQLTWTCGGVAYVSKRICYQLWSVWFKKILCKSNCFIWITDLLFFRTYWTTLETERNTLYFWKWVCICLKYSIWAADQRKGRIAQHLWFKSRDVEYPVSRFLADYHISLKSLHRKKKKAIWWDLYCCFLLSLLNEVASEATSCFRSLIHATVGQFPYWK